MRIKPRGYRNIERLYFLERSSEESRGLWNYEVVGSRKGVLLVLDLRLGRGGKSLEQRQLVRV